MKFNIGKLGCAALLLASIFNSASAALITSSSLESFQGFGQDVSQSGNYILVGASSIDEFTGSAYVYDMSKAQSDGNYAEIKLPATGATREMQIGFSVSQSGNNILRGWHR